MRFLPSLLFSTFLCSAVAQPLLQPVEIHKDFEGASIGKIEAQSESEFRLHLEGQQNAFGRNRQTTWYYFRLDHVEQKPLTLCLTDFIGEYNGKPASGSLANLPPYFSYDGELWEQFQVFEWNDTLKEGTLRFTPEKDSVYIAHVPPYTHSKFLHLLSDLSHNPNLLPEVIGKSVQGRDLYQFTVTDSTEPDVAKKCVWLQARQHAWEAGSSWVMEGALRFITSDDPEAVELRKKVLFKFTPMVDPDGCANGKVRFNSHGYDVNRNWHEVDLRTKAILEKYPEIWYTKKAIAAAQSSANPIDLMVNIHNTETAEYLDSNIDDETANAPLIRLFKRLKADSLFDPSRLPTFGGDPLGTANHLWLSHKVPVALMELRIGPSAKLHGRCPTTEDRLKFGAELIRQIGKVVLER
jgi:hypothetical protein